MGQPEGSDGWVKVNEALIPAQANGSRNGNRYHYLDGRAEHGVAYAYKLEVIGADGSVQWSGAASAQAPRRWFLPQIGFHLGGR